MPGRPRKRPSIIPPKRWVKVRQKAVHRKRAPECPKTRLRRAAAAFIDEFGDCVPLAGCSIPPTPPTAAAVDIAVATARAAAAAGRAAPATAGGTAPAVSAAGKVKNTFSMLYVYKRQYLLTDIGGELGGGIVRDLVRVDSAVATACVAAAAGRAATAVTAASRPVRLTRREEALDDTRRSFTLDLEIIISRLQSFGTELTREKSFSTNCSK